MIIHSLFKPEISTFLKYTRRISLQERCRLETILLCLSIFSQLPLNLLKPYLVTATAMSYTGNLLSRNRYFPMSVSAAAESIASRPTRFLSRYGVASLPYKSEEKTLGSLDVRYVVFCRLLKELSPLCSTASTTKCHFPMQSSCRTIRPCSFRWVVNHQCQDTYWVKKRKLL